MSSTPVRRLGRALLRARNERPRGHATEQRDELAALHLRAHSITSSAATSSLSGTVRPSALAVFKIDQELEFRRLLDRQVRRGGALEDTTRIDAEFGITIDVEERFETKPAYLAADTAYGSADALNWIVNEKKIAPHIPVIDKSKSEDGTFSREDFSSTKNGTFISAQPTKC